jgi:hypothetical protein
MLGCTDNIVHGCIRWTKKFIVKNILPILTCLIIMASAAAQVIEFRHVLKLFIISTFEDIQENSFSGKMECPNSLAAVH